jgi:signal transduction histidine kinase
MAAGAVLLRETSSGSLTTAATHTRDAQLFRPAASRTIAQAAMNGAQGILSVEPEKDERFSPGSSVHGLQMDSMMCVPLRAPRGEMIGALQIDTRDTGPKFTESDLDVLVSVAALAAMSIENARLHDELEARISERTRQYSEALEALREAHDELEERVARRTADLQRSNDDLQQFAYVVSHDLKAPLRTIASFSQLLQRTYGGGAIDEQADKWLGFVERGALHMDALIDDLLTLSRVATRGGPSVETDSQEVFDKTTSLLQTVIAESGATITSDPLPMVRVDGMQLLQLLQNLIGNAIRFRGESAPEVHVAACRTADATVTAPDGARWPADAWLFSVRDNGIGIDSEAHSRVFDIFQRLHRQEDIPGNGIGLAVCRKIVERHDGRIWVESEPGQGSTFWFYFPDQPEEQA